MTAREEAQWRRALIDGSLFPYQEEHDSTEQMQLWREAGALLKEIAVAAGLSTGTVWARLTKFGAQQAEEATA
jgi:hypothetical protein